MLLLKKEARRLATVDEGGDPHRVVDHDIRSQICPSSLLAALKVVNESQAELRRGAVTLRFRTDNRDATATIPDAVGHMGYQVAVDKHQGYYVITVAAAPRAGGRTS